MDRKNLVSLLVATGLADRSVPATYSYNGQQLNFEAMNMAARNELNELAKTYEEYEANKSLIFSIMKETMDVILPKKVLDRYGDFAEIKQFAQGTKPVFIKKTGRRRAKQFITRVGLAGVYEVFKLGQKNFELKTSAIGGAAQIGFEEFLDGRADFAEVTEIVMEGMDEVIYLEIAQALIGSISQLPPANKVSVSGFDETGMDRLISVASAYGTPVIYCTREFAAKMIPSSANWISEQMKDAKWNVGYLGVYKGCKVIVLDQSFEDETNAMKVIDPGYAWIIPSGGDDKPVKVAFEGTTHIRERENEDWSKDIQVYRKVGVGVIMTNNICSYTDTSLAGHRETIPTV